MAAPGCNAELWNALRLCSADTDARAVVGSTDRSCVLLTTNLWMAEIDDNKCRSDIAAMLYLLYNDAD